MTSFHGYCFVSISPIRAEKSDKSEIVSQLLFGEPITINEVDYSFNVILDSILTTTSLVLQRQVCTEFV
jgi:hypothetical protein